MLWAGPLLARGGFVEGWFDPESDEEGQGPPPGDALEGLILPPFRNCHTHLGDTLARDEVPDAPLAKLVGPDGFKHRWLAEADVAASIAAGLREAAASGTALILDFRESGEAGLAQLARGAPPLLSRDVIGSSAAVQRSAPVPVAYSVQFIVASNLNGNCPSSYKSEQSVA